MGFTVIPMKRISRAMTQKSILSLHCKRDGGLHLYFSTCSLDAKIGDKYDILIGIGKDEGKLRFFINNNGKRTIRKSSVSKTNSKRLSFFMMQESLFNNIAKIPFNSIIIEETIVQKNLVEIDMMKYIKLGQNSVVKEIDGMI